MVGYFIISDTVSIDYELAILRAPLLFREITKPQFFSTDKHIFISIKLSLTTTGHRQPTTDYLNPPPPSLSQPN